MSREPHSRVPPLKLVINGDSHKPMIGDDTDNIEQTRSAIRDIDWSILMARAQKGDQAAYFRLLQEITPYLRSLVARKLRDRNDIEDAIQDVLLTVHSIRHAYDPLRPFGPWLFAITSRRCVDRLRRHGRLRTHEIPLAAEHEVFVEPRANPEEKAGRQGLEVAIEKLPPMQKQAIRLLKIKEMSLKEAATATGMSIASLKVATHRALKNLRNMLTDRRDM